MNPPLPSPESAWESVRQHALGLGFGAVGVAPAQPLEAESADLAEWIAQGRHASMDWMERTAQKRGDPEQVLPGCRSVVIVTLDYLVEEETESPQAPSGRVSRYAQGRDYHRVLEKKLRKLARFIDETTRPALPSRPFCDHGPVMERQWAERAGIGFRGKNTLLIRPDAGSWFFLGGVLTQAVLQAAQAPNPIREGCGNCRACLDACPTGALDAPWQIDARRCISYLTIEHDGLIDPALWSSMQGWVFGCDICQEVCPYNRKRAVAVETDPLAPRTVPAQWSLVEMLRLTDADVAAIEGSTPLRRAGRERLVRNAAIAAAMRGGPEEKSELERIARDPTEPEWMREVMAGLLLQGQRRAGSED